VRTSLGTKLAAHQMVKGRNFFFCRSKNNIFNHIITFGFSSNAMNENCVPRRLFCYRICQNRNEKKNQSKSWREVCLHQCGRNYFLLLPQIFL
jgi:hypothetical protein